MWLFNATCRASGVGGARELLVWKGGIGRSSSKSQTKCVQHRAGEGEGEGRAKGGGLEISIR